MDNLSVRQLNSLADSYPKNAEMQKDKVLTLLVAKRNSALLAYSSKEILADKSLALAIVKNDGRALRFFSDEIRSDEEVVLAAVENFCASFSFAQGDAKKSKKNNPVKKIQEFKTEEYSVARLEDVQEINLDDFEMDNSMGSKY